MIVCHCMRVNDRTIRAEIAKGAETADEVSEGCGAGARCGSCRPTIVALLATRVATRREQPAA